MLRTSVASQIATLIMSAPPVNALSSAWVAGFSHEIDALLARRDWKVLPAAALAAAKQCMTAAAIPGRGGYGDELEATRDLQTNAETRQLISAFVAGARS